MSATLQLTLEQSRLEIILVAVGVLALVLLMSVLVVFNSISKFTDGRAESKQENTPPANLAKELNDAVDNSKTVVTDGNSATNFESLPSLMPASSQTGDAVDLGDILNTSNDTRMTSQANRRDIPGYTSDMDHPLQDLPTEDWLPSLDEEATLYRRVMSWRTDINGQRERLLVRETENKPASKRIDQGLD